MTTFLTPWGRYRYRNLPRGFLAAGDACTARYNEITKDFSQMEKCVDDTLLWDGTLEENFRRTCEYLTHCSARGITFNEKKFKFGRMEVEFLGYIITADSVKPSAEFLEGGSRLPNSQRCVWGEKLVWLGQSGELCALKLQGDGPVQGLAKPEV